MDTELNRREFLRNLGLGVGAAGLALAGCEPIGRAFYPRPNVLLIMTDDQGWGDIHSHGNDLIDTPVMDALAASGARFDRFYVSPVCAPTRASLLTGRYHLRTGVHGVTRGRETMRSDEVTLADIFKAAGYATGALASSITAPTAPVYPFRTGLWRRYHAALDKEVNCIRSRKFKESEERQDQQNSVFSLYINALLHNGVDHAS